MADHTLTGALRTVAGRQVGQVRRAGFVPGTIYGPKTTPVNVQFPYRALQVALMKAGGTHLINLTVENDRDYTVIAREVQRDIIRGDILHVDFFALDLNARLRTDVPLHFVGESPAVQSKQAILITGSNNLTVELLPSQLISVIEVDISKLTAVGDAIHVSDIKLAKGIDIINDPEEMLAKLIQPSAARSEEEEAAADAESASQPEVITKGKEDEEE
jgi:large subunit ribosomal protein L25